MEVERWTVGEKLVMTREVSALANERATWEGGRGRSKKRRVARHDLIACDKRARCAMR